MLEKFISHPKKLFLIDGLGAILSAFLLGLCAIFLILGILADMLDRIRSNQERILYHLKKSKR